MSRWSLEEQIEKVDSKIKELQARRKELLLKQSELQREKEKEQVQELYEALKAKGIEPDQYAEFIQKIEGK